MPKLIILILLLFIIGNTLESSSSVKIVPTDKWTLIGKETIVVQNKSIELKVWVKKEFYNDEEYYIYRKENEDRAIMVDSTVDLDGTYSIWENNYITRITRRRERAGSESFRFFNESGNTIKKYYTGLTKNEIYDENGWLKPYLKEVRGDTAFVDLEYYDAIIIPVDANTLLDLEMQELKSLKRRRDCSELNEYNDMPKSICLRYERSDISTGKNKGKVYAPGKKQYATFGLYYAKPLVRFNCERDPTNGHYYHTYKEDELLENISIAVMESNWKYDKKNNQWTELCWSTEDMQKTYEHEVQHYRNAKKAIEYFYNKYLFTKKNKTETNNLFTQKDCIDTGNDLIKKVMDDYNQWEKEETKHSYVGFNDHIPPSSKPLPQNRVPVPCPN